MIVQDVAFDRRLVAGLGEPEEADAAQAGEIVSMSSALKNALNSLARDIAIAGIEQCLRRTQERQMQVDAAFDAVERVVGGAPRT